MEGRKEGREGGRKEGREGGRKEGREGGRKEGRKETLRTQMLPEKMRKIMAKNSNKKYQVGYRIGFRNNVTIQASQLV